MLGDRQAEASEPSSDQIAGVGIDRDGLLLAALDLQSRAILDGDDLLADMLRLRHVAERVRDPCDRKHPVRQGTERVVLEARLQLPQQRAGEVRARVHQIHGEHREVLAQGPHPDLAILVDVGLADLDEPSVGPQNREVLVDRVAGQRVQDDIDAFAVGQLQHLVGEGEAARIHHMRHPERGEQGPFLGRAGGREHDSARFQRQLHCRQPDAAGAGMDQHPLSLPHLTERMQRIVGGEEGERDRRSLLEREVRRLARNEPLVDRHVAGEVSELGGNDLVADGKPRDLVADGDDAAGALQAELVARGHRPPSPPAEAIPSPPSGP